MNNPTVSVLMITYNQEKYIRDAIEGVLIQKTKFPLELIIGEDHSTDSTGNICKEYSRKYQETIKILHSEKTLGALANFINSLEACNGKYVAICEGDDYWTDPFKLQKQVDFLENNPDYALVHTNKKDRKGETFFDDKEEYKQMGYIIEDLLLSNNISILTILARTDIFKETVRNVFCHSKARNWQMLDYPLWIYISMNHKIGYLNDVMGVYRFLPESLSHSLNSHKSLSFDKCVIDIKEFYFKEYLKKNPNIDMGFKLRFKENIFHLRKRLLFDYGLIAKSEIFSLLKTNPIVYFYIFYMKFKKYKVVGQKFKIK